MSDELTYTKAFEKLEKLVMQIENEEIQLDVLAEKVKEANELIGFCERRLREIEGEVRGQ